MKTFTFIIGIMQVSIKALDVHLACNKLFKQAIKQPDHIFQSIKLHYPNAFQASLAGQGMVDYLVIKDKQGNILTQIELTNWFVN